MRKQVVLLLGVMINLSLLTQSAAADIVLTFEQDVVGNHQNIAQSYGDRVTSPTDSNGHAYGIVAGSGLGFAPNVEVAYGPGDPALWTTGYGDLSTVYINDMDGDDSMSIEFVADTGFEVGLFGFDVASFFSAGQTVQGLRVFDETNQTLWSVGSTLIVGDTHNDFEFQDGLFGETLTLEIDLTGLGNVSDDIGIDNVQFSQRSSVPEPSGAIAMLLGAIGMVIRRKR